jgi:hypothetical protein
LRKYFLLASLAQKLSSFSRNQFLQPSLNGGSN